MDEVASVAKSTISCPSKFITDSCLSSSYSLTIASIVLRSIAFVDEVAAIAKFAISSLSKFTTNSSFLSCLDPLDTIIADKLWSIALLFAIKVVSVSESAITLSKDSLVLTS